MIDTGNRDGVGLLDTRIGYVGKARVCRSNSGGFYNSQSLENPAIIGEVGGSVYLQLKLGRSQHIDGGRNACGRRGIDAIPDVG